MSFLSLSKNAASIKDQPYAINEPEVITPKPVVDVEAIPAVDKDAVPTITLSNDEHTPTSDQEIAKK